MSKEDIVIGTKFTVTEDIPDRSWYEGGLGSPILLSKGSYVVVRLWDCGEWATLFPTTQPENAPLHHWDVYEASCIRAIELSWILFVSPDPRIKDIVIGKGTCVEGVDYEMSRIRKEEVRFEKTDHRVEGWTNRATFMAHMVISNDGDFLKKLNQMTRPSDNGLHPNKLEKEFRNLHPTFFDDDFLFYGDFPRGPKFCQRVDWHELSIELFPVEKKALRKAKWEAQVAEVTKRLTAAK